MGTEDAIVLLYYTNMCVFELMCVASGVLRQQAKCILLYTQNCHVSYVYLQHADVASVPGLPVTYFAVFNCER